jgi:hypothetical protein
MIMATRRTEPARNALGFHGTQQPVENNQAKGCDDGWQDTAGSVQDRKTAYCFLR